MKVKTQITRTAATDRPLRQENTYVYAHFTRREKFGHCQILGKHLMLEERFPEGRKQAKKTDQLIFQQMRFFAMCDFYCAFEKTQRLLILSVQSLIFNSTAFPRLSTTVVAVCRLSSRTDLCSFLLALQSPSHDWDYKTKLHRRFTGWDLGKASTCFAFLN